MSEGESGSGSNYGEQLSIWNDVLEIDEYVGVGVGMTNAQAALIAAAISMSRFNGGEAVTGTAELYLKWLGDKDKKHS